MYFKTHPVLPSTPRPRDTGRSSRSGRRYGLKYNLLPSSFLSTLMIVCVLHPNLPTILLPTGYLLFLDSIILATCPPIIVEFNGYLIVYRLMYGSTDKYSASTKISIKKIYIYIKYKIINT